MDPCIPPHTDNSSVKVFNLRSCSLLKRQLPYFLKKKKKKKKNNNLARPLFLHPSLASRNSGAGSALLSSPPLSLSPLLHHRVPPALPLFPLHYAAAPSAPQLSRSPALSHIEAATTHALSLSPSLPAHARAPTGRQAHTPVFPAVSRYGAAAFPAAYQVCPRRGMGGHSSRVSQRCAESCESRGCWRKSAAILLYFFTSAQESSSVHTSNPGI